MLRHETARYVPCLRHSLLLLAAGCEGPQSALLPAGHDAKVISDLFWVMAVGAAVIWLVVMALALYAVLYRGDEPGPKKARLFVVGGGALLPTIVLMVLLVHGLGKMPELLAHGAADGPRIRISGEQWWWRVRYEMPDGSSFELANELWLPVAQRIPLWLESPDVIHSLWVPPIAGKVDLIPGRVNRMALEPTQTGIFRGACAEYCGSSHARMLLFAVVVTEDEFMRWAALQREPAQPPETETAARGAALFAALGCGACHTVRGTSANGVVGPDLTHVGSRVALASGVLENDVAGFEEWLADTKEVKPGVHMPTFDMLSTRELHALSTYLNELE